MADFSLLTLLPILKLQDSQGLLFELLAVASLRLCAAVQDTEVVGQCKGFSRVVVLDGTWPKARGLLQHPKLQGLRKVQLPPNVRTTFWYELSI